MGTKPKAKTRCCNFCVCMVIQWEDLCDMNPIDSKQWYKIFLENCSWMGVAVLISQTWLLNWRPTFCAYFTILCKLWRLQNRRAPLPFFLLICWRWFLPTLNAWVHIPTSLCKLFVSHMMMTHTRHSIWRPQDSSKYLLLYSHVYCSNFIYEIHDQNLVRQGIAPN